jgi:succinate dehydrogenase / fumarate reductase cytochrome b subunit
MSRPLSPHLFIYKPEISSLFSVFHRATGIFLTLGILFFICLIQIFLYNITYYPIYFLVSYLDTYFAWFIISLFIILIFSFSYHFLNGIRHLFWDFSSKNTLNIKYIKISAYFILFFTFLFSIFFIFYVL